jgi:hypothetical protein
MKTLTTLLTSALLASTAFIGTAQAEVRSDNALYDIIHPESADIFNVGSDYQKSAPQGIVSLNDDHNANSVWSYEFEQYVNPADFQLSNQITDVNQYLSDQPSASGSRGHEVFIYNEMAGEYHLQ